MRVFVTGASGHIGSAVIPELVRGGHQVVGLARSERAAAALTALGADVQHGDLDDLDGLRAAAFAADGVIHLAFNHDAMRAGDLEGATGADMAAIEALAEALVDTGKALVGTSGTAMLAPLALDRAGTEDDVVDGGYRVDAENRVIALADRGVRSSVVRLPPVVHSVLDKHGFIPTLIDRARATGLSGYRGDGANRWPAVHTLDAARIYRLALENAPAGSRLHAVADDGIAFRAIAERIGRRLGIPAASVPNDQAETQFGWLAMLVGLDNRTSSARTQRLLDWEPTHPGLLAELDEDHYFEATR